MKNFTEQLADIEVTIFKKDNEIKFLNDEVGRLKRAIRRLHLERCESKSNKNNET